MLSFEVNGKAGHVKINLPTSFSEVTPAYLKNVTSDIHIADDYSLIGILYKESLSSVLLASTRKQKNITTAIVPIFVKSGHTNNNYIESLHCGEKIIIAPSDIELGHHVVCPKNFITINNIVNYCDGDKDVYQKSLNNRVPCYYLEFKLVPNCAIHGNYNAAGDDFDNPFVTFTTEGGE